MGPTTVLAALLSLLYVYETLSATLPVCIIGAGPSGLTVARRLETKKREVVLFESQPKVGGKAQALYEEDESVHDTCLARYS